MRIFMFWTLPPSLWIYKIMTTSSHTYYTQASIPSPSFSHSTDVLGTGESLGLALEVLTLRECLPLLLQDRCLEQPTPGVEVPHGLGRVCLRLGRKELATCVQRPGGGKGTFGFSASSYWVSCARHCSEHQEYRNKEDLTQFLSSQILHCSWKNR